MKNVAKSIINWLVPISKERVIYPDSAAPKIVFVDARCSRTGKPILMRFQHEDPNLWLLTSSVSLKGDHIENGVKVRKEISGIFDMSPRYKGCPYCGSLGYGLCFCDRLFCTDAWEGKPIRFKCPWCGKKGVLNRPINKMEASMWA